MKKLLLFAIAIAVTSLQAATIHVPGDQPTIQAGINAAINGDTVLVAPGTYSGDGNWDIDFQGKTIVLSSASGAAITIIDCDGTVAEPHRAIFMHSGEDSTTVIDGFTITGANDTAGAVYCSGAGLKLLCCIITGNASNGVRQVAGGVTWLVIDSCVITGNFGDGVYATRFFAIRHSTLAHNSGRGLWGEDPAAEASVAFTIFANNTLAGMAGRSFAGHMASAKNCTFVGNYDGLACVLDLPYASDIAQWPTVENCIMAFNRHYGYASGGYVQPKVTCSNAYGNVNKDWMTYSPPQPGDTFGNISSDPLFCDTAIADFRLMDASPCMPAHNSCRSLIGALDVGCFCCVKTTGDINMAGTVDLSDLSALVEYLTGGGYFLPCPDAANVNRVGIIDLSDLSSLVSYLTGGGYILPDCTASAFYPNTVGSYWVYADTTFDQVAHSVLSATLDSITVIGIHHDSLGIWSVLTQPISWVSDTFMVKGDTLFSREIGYTGGTDPAPSFASAEYIPARDTPIVFTVLHEDMMEWRTVERVDTTIVCEAGSFVQCVHYYQAGATEVTWNDFVAPRVGLVHSRWEIRPMGRPDIDQLSVRWLIKYHIAH